MDFVIDLPVKVLAQPQSFRPHELVELPESDFDQLFNELEFEVINYHLVYFLGMVVDVIE